MITGNLAKYIGLQTMMALNISESKLHLCPNNKYFKPSQVKMILYKFVITETIISRAILRIKSSKQSVFFSNNNTIQFFLTSRGNYVRENILTKPVF